MNELTIPKRNLGFQEIELGEKLSYSPIKRCKGKKDKREMVQLLSSRPLAVRYHFEKGIGFYYCFGGSCCERGNPLNIRYVFPIVLFNTDVRGKIVSNDFEVQYLQLGSEAYDNLILKFEVNPDLLDRLILISCNDEKYQRLSMEVAGESPLKKDEEWRKLVEASYQELRPHIPTSIARLVSNEKEFQQLLRKYSGEVNDVDIEEFDVRSRSTGKELIDVVEDSMSGVSEAQDFLDELGEI